MNYTIKPFEELDIIDDFLMNAIAADAEVGERFCRVLLSALLQRKIGKIKVIAQRVLPAQSPGLRGIRMDVEVTEYDEKDIDFRAKNIYDLEPSRNHSVYLPKHNRFYQAKIDYRNMESGENDFRKLPNLYVITITNYDPFGYDYMMYTIHNKCEEVPELEYEDGLKFIYFNTTGMKGGNVSIKKLLKYLSDSNINNVTDEVTRELHECVSHVRVHPEVRDEYMTLEHKIFYERLDAKNEGKIESSIEYILETLSEYGTFSEELTERIKAERDLDTLRKWHKLALKVESVEKFMEKM